MNYTTVRSDTNKTVCAFWQTMVLTTISIALYLVPPFNFESEIREHYTPTKFA